MQPTSLKSRILLALFFLFVACSAFDKTKHTEEIQQAMTKHKHINRLAKESSPYLLQHAHNPVDWFPWGEEALEKAKREDKLILISIGYAACHWCHVMEHESFEDEAVAKVMNESFVCIKVDREERPDIDQVYMNAVQLLTGRGGWPLNCFALPDGRPVHGGTYFPKAQWLQILDGLKTVYAQDRDRVLKAASEIQRGIQTSEVISTKTAISEFQQDYLAQVIEPWKKEFDTVWGGSGESPKFPMPNSLRFLLRYAFFTGDEAVNTQLFLTLDRMAHGGIYDQIGGGFARYSVDKYWKAPHFEKMLYDNGQLLSLYSEAYLLNPKRLYKETVYETIQFAQRELLSKEGGFYASLDADSEGVEGKYYTFKANEFADLLNQDNHILRAFYNITEEGNWEETNIPFIVKSETEFAEEHKIAEADLWNMLKNFKTSAYQAREKRIRPGLDDKILASWNGLMLKGLVDAYRTFGEHTFLELAEKNAEFIANKLITDDHRLFRNYKNSTASVNAFLDDYAFVIEGFLALYQVSFDEKWLGLAENLMEYARVHFEDEESGMFFFTSDLDPELVARKMELNDGVIPASNSQMALNLFYLGKLLYNDEYLTMANQMLHNVKAFIPKAGAYYSNWATLAALEVFPFYEIAIVGADAQAYRSELQATYRPNAIYAGSLQKSEVPLLTDRFVKGETRIYVCQDKACQMPAKSVEDAENQIDKLKR